MTASIAGSGLYRFFHKGDEETIALKGVDLAVEPGEFVALVGPSGSGKSTLLACLAGLDEPDGGSVLVMDERMSQRTEQVRARLRARHIGMLMQSGNLLDHLTVAENIALQQWLAGTHGTLDDLLGSVGLQRRADARPGQLSGGEAARAGLCVALAATPKILICDEPTAEVDRDTEETIVSVFRARRREGTAIIVATHSQALANEADRIVTIREGAIEP